MGCGVRVEDYNNSNSAISWGGTRERGDRVRRKGRGRREEERGR